MMKRAMLITLCLLFSFGPQLRADNSPLPKRPNIIFIFSDDHSLQTIGAYKSRLSAFCREQNITPNIDQLASNGGVFVNSFCGNSLCSPSRATILSGLHSHANGVERLDQRIKPGLWTFPKALKGLGYRTAVFGKWHLSTTLPEHEDWNILPGQGDYLNPVFINQNGRKKYPGYVTDITTDMAVDWIKTQAPTTPFFLSIHQKAPHRNWIPPLRYAKWLDDTKVPEPDTLFDDYSHRASGAKLQTMSIEKDLTMDSDLKVGPSHVSNPLFEARNIDYAAKKPIGKDLIRWKYQQYVKDYLRCVKAVDDGVGRVMDTLKSTGLDENTIVIYASDQGFYMGEHGWFDKRWIYEQSLHMPFIIRWPGVVKPGQRFTPFIQNIDYAATFVDIAGGRAPDQLHGASIVPILRGNTPKDWRKSVYYHYYDKDGSHNVENHYGVRTERYTLAYYYGTREWELFDNKKDPNQMKSVYSDARYTQTIVDLKLELQQLRELYKDTTNEAKVEKGGADGRPF